MKFLTNLLHSHSRAAVIVFQFFLICFQEEQGAESQKEHLMKFLTNQLHSHSRAAVIFFSVFPICLFKESREQSLKKRIL